MAFLLVDNASLLERFAVLSASNVAGFDSLWAAAVDGGVRGSIADTSVAAVAVVELSTSLTTDGAPGTAAVCFVNWPHLEDFLLAICNEAIGTL
jgi:hypothetical protein